MFSLLNPIGLWFGAALAVPLMIHFLGRQRLNRRPFPSLLLVRERFSKSMHRHRLKNLLLLILRTLLILCLLLALSNPAIESRHASVKPDLSLALIHNGIYGRLGAEAEGSAAAAPGLLLSGAARGPERAGWGLPKPGGNALKTQWLRIRAIDSSQGIATRVVPVIADGPGSLEVSERFGDFGEAVGQVLGALGPNPGTARIQLPVFSWIDAERVKGALLRGLRENPGLEIALTDFTAVAGKVNAFAGLRATPSPGAPTVSIQARLSRAAAESKPGKIQVSLNGRLFQESAAEGGRAEVTLPLGQGARSTGKLSFGDRGFAIQDAYFCIPQSGDWMLAHAGSALASLPSLGRETYYRRIVHVAAARNIPWSGAGSAEASAAPNRDRGARAAGRGSRAELRLVYLSCERGSQPETFARAVEFVKQGGRLIIGVGRDSDVPLLNRFLLQPLRLGRLGNLVENTDRAPVTADRRALARLGGLSGNFGTLGAVRKRFSFAPESGVDILLSQGGSREGTGAAEAVLAARDFHRGRVLLWTTDIDNLDWSDLGVDPFTPLLHQAMQESGSDARAVNLSVASDSVYTAALDPGPETAGDGLRTGPSRSGFGTSGSGSRAEVRDPEGRPFTKVRIDGERLRIGPFDKLGIYNIITGQDTAAFAVNLAAEPGMVPDGTAREAVKEDFLKDFAAYRGRLTVAGPDDPILAQASMRRLWPALLLAAILLLLLEGLISATFSLRKNRP